jgi:hypothetical protein
MADAYTQLASLREMLRVRRNETMEKMARGVDKGETHHELVGRCKALREVIGNITEQIRDINGGADDEPSPA